jgi:hypothetical protein
VYTIPTLTPKVIENVDNNVREIYPETSANLRSSTRRSPESRSNRIQDSTCSKKIKATDVEFKRKSVSTDVAEQSAGIAEPSKCFDGTDHDTAEKPGDFLAA